MKNRNEIQKMHDKLIAVLLNEVPSPFVGPDAHKAMTACTNVLCWVLDHDHNRAFQDLIDDLDAFLLDCGVVVVEGQNPNRRKPS